MKEQKPKYCKCGHLLETHQENKKILGFNNIVGIKCKGQCKVERLVEHEGEEFIANVKIDCDCRRYTRRNYPTRSERVFNYFCLGFSILAVGFLFFLSYTGDQLINNCTSDSCHKILNEKEFTLKQAIHGIDLVFFLLGLGLIIYVLLPSISLVLQKKIPIKEIQE